MRAAVVVFVAVAVVVIGATASAQTTKPATIKLETSGRVLRLLEGSGYRYEKLSNTTWLLSFKGEHLESIPVYVIVTDDELTLLGVIGASSNIDKTAGAARELLKSNNRRDGLVVYLDSDDDYVVHSRHQLKQLNTASFKASVQSVAVAADDGFGTIRSLPATAGTTTPRDSHAYRIPASANHSVEFLNGRATITMDSARWKQTKSDEQGRLNFQHSSGDVAAMVIAERIAIPMDKLKAIAVSNAKEVSKDVQVVEEGRRNVNGVEVLLMRLEGTVDGVPFAYLGYYYGGDQGSIQVITYTGRNLLDEYRSVMEEFLNGFRLK